MRGRRIMPRYGIKNKKKSIWLQKCLFNFAQKFVFVLEISWPETRRPNFQHVGGGAEQADSSRGRPADNSEVSRWMDPSDRPRLRILAADGWRISYLKGQTVKKLYFDE